MTVLNACATTHYETKIEYITPTIPESMLEPCKEINVSFETNGELLMSFISLQTAYLECASKVISISSIINSYNDVYHTEIDE